MVNEGVAEMLTVGSELSWITWAVATAEQALLPVSVIEYVPAAVALMVCVVAPVFQRYVLVPPALKLTDELAHVSVALAGLILTVGTLLSWNTWALAVAVHPLLLITVTE
ncbi:hypothetical protein GCM10027592_21970 [Spirosoma flavus]